MADIISSLPDAILCHILSFLQTKHAVASGILSKRWNHVWAAVPVLDLSHTRVTDAAANYRFNKYVSFVLRSRDPAHVIKSFHLQVTYHYSKRSINNITKWINFVLQRRLEYLYLHVNAMSLQKLPITILTCNTLVVLKLVGFRLEDQDQDDQYSCAVAVLPSLKTLVLKYIAFPRLRDFIMFLSRCPILEDLLTLHVSFASNQSLTCIEWNRFCLTNLTKADINSAYCYLPLKPLHNLTSLRFEINKVHFRYDFIPTFHNLTQLELISLDYCWSFLLRLLNHCPKLQRLHIDQADSDKRTWYRQEYKEYWVDPDVVPQCLSLHLTTCHLFNFLGLRGELQLARYILMKAKVLQTMKINNVGQFQMKRLISLCPRASTTCKVIICQRLNKTG